MRILMIDLIAVAMLCVHAAAANAYGLFLTPTTPTIAGVGDIISFDLILDTQYEIGLNSLSASITFDPTVVSYRPDLSATNSYYPFYVPSDGKFPSAWLEPSPFDGNFCSAADPICSNPPEEWGGALPQIGGQVNIDFVSATYPVGILGFDYLGTGNSDLRLAIVSFELVGEGLSAGAFGFGNGGNGATAFGWSQGPDAIDITDQFTVSGNVTMGTVPEPTTALLLGLGLAVLGAVTRYRC